MVLRVTCQNQPQPSDPQDPDEHPPPPMGLVEEMPKPERGPASMYSTLISPQVSSRLSSTRKVNSFWSYTLSFSFGSSRANPREGPDQLPCIRATRTAESILFCDRYDFRFSTAVGVISNMISSSIKKYIKNKYNLTSSYRNDKKDWGRSQWPCPIIFWCAGVCKGILTRKAFWFLKLKKMGLFLTRNW